MEFDSNIDDQQVIEYLSANPDFFQTYSNELSDLKLEHASGGAVSLIERQVEVLRERIYRMRRRMNTLLQTARSNDELFAKVRSLTLALLDVSTWHDLNEVLATNMLVEFDADYVCCHVEGGHVNFDHVRSYDGAAPFAQFVNGPLPLCATLRASELKALFPDQSLDRDGSAVLIPLTPSQGAGCLAVGSRETHHFTRDLDTFFVSHIGDMLSRVIDHLARRGSEEPSAGEREGTPLARKEPSAGEREGTPLAGKEPSAGEREGTPLANKRYPPQQE